MFVRYPLGRFALRVTGRSPCSASAFQRRRFAWSTCRSVCRRRRPVLAGEPGRCIRSERRSWSSTQTAPSAAPPAEVAVEVGRLAAREGQGELDRQAASAIQHLLIGDGADRAGPRRLGTRTWSIPAKAYWLSGPYNHHGHAPTEAPGHAGQRPSIDRGPGGPTIPAGSPPGRSRPSGSRQPLPGRGMRRPRRCRHGIHERG